MIRRYVACLFVGITLLTPQLASAYLVANAVPLPELAENSDVIFTGTVVSTGIVEDESFGKTNGYAPHETLFRVVSVVKGRIETKEIRFRHFAENKDQLIMTFSPQHYEFDVNRTYIVCANLTDDPKVLRQIWDNHRAKEDQGVLRTANDEPHVGADITEVYWHELVQLLRAKNSEDSIYAIGQLNAMSGARYDSHKTFDRKKALDQIMSLAESTDDEVAIKAIDSIGLGNARVGGTMAALFAINPAHFPGHAVPEEQTANEPARWHFNTLVRIAQSESSSKRRSVAIKSLGQSFQPELLPLAQRWITDEAAEVRAAATIVLSDYAGQVSRETWETLLADDDDQVRRSAIRAIGIGQITELLDEVTGLLSHPDPEIVADAAAALLSFPLEDSREILMAQMDHKEFGCLFINALAAEETETYAERLGQIVRTTPVPKSWWGGHMTWGISWNLLFKYVQQQPAEKLLSGEFDAILASLESPVTEREQSNHYSSSEPRDLYALYIQRGMSRRAKVYRKAVNEKTRYDMDIYFNHVDARPNDFQRG